ncbi:hypothetical protein CH373_16760 [Leptospira perolatii]|uniref:Uncharacterized protein n=1 Tax=Leptospira perolatii TaxID=2023191 RepID=A0A2M9ZJ65_9LEPT|nr:hypothetical protein [Leptospira perolatii]PJZ68646.1 hypothetical protein CH360_15305 [Leptospira perolatii]PJZ71993.1 hypothetical protein CH373_16760 [Leptospira perolatii]
MAKILFHSSVWILILSLVLVSNSGLLAKIAKAKKSLQMVVELANCKVRSRTVSLPNPWEKKEFELQVKESILADCKNEDGSIYKFLIEEESFLNETKAYERFPRIQEIPPDLKRKYGERAAAKHPEFQFRTGFLRYNKVCILSAFIPISDEELEKWKLKLEKEIQQQ